MTTTTAITVRDVRAADHNAWAELFRGYRSFYEFAPDDAVVDTVWSWLADPTHSVHGLVAERGNTIIGIAHYRSFARPSTGTVGTWIDDLYTCPESRGGGIGRALIDAVTDRAGQQGHSIVRWITAADNSTAQLLYDSLAAPTNWVVYDRPAVIA